jgi:hypothetical protein
MRIDEVLTERFQTSDTYTLVYTRVLEALRDIVPKVTKYNEGEYYAGDVMDALSHVLDPVLHQLMDDRVRYLFFVLKQGNGDQPGGSISRPGNGNTIFTVEFPKAWVSHPPNMFYYQVRDNGKAWAGAIATVFVHELVHLEQQIRRGDRIPRGGHKKFTADKPADYLADDDEIGAQAVSTALELIQWAGDAKTALKYFRRKGSVEGLAVSTLIPHLGQNYQHLRGNRPAWNRYLKAVIWNLQHHVTPSSPDVVNS